MTIRQQISTKQIFTETEKSITAYILERPQDISDMSIRELAQVTYTSAPTVLRVCRKLGFNGFNEFKKALLIELENEKHINENIDVSKPFYQYESPSRIIGSLSSLYKECVEATSAMLNLSELMQLADAMYSAHRIFIYAVGDTQITCRLFANKLIKLNIHPILAAENNQAIEETYNVRKDDIALFVTYKGVNQMLKPCAAVLNHRKIRSGLITCNPKSPLATFCSDIILLPPMEHLDKIATFYSQISIGFVLNVLYSLVYEKDYEQHERHKKVLDSLTL